MIKYESHSGAVYNADNMEVLKSLPDNSIDSCVTDPPYGISFMGKKWDYDVPSIELWKEVLRVLKPGAHALIACGTRTQHRMVCNIEDAGFEVRDVISWVYGSGFPKSLNVSKALDKLAGVKRSPVLDMNGNQIWTSQKQGKKSMFDGGKERPATYPATYFNGWGTALKPACEFFTLARKPISETNIAENILRWGTGGINIDECRVGDEKRKYTKLSYMVPSGKFSGQGANVENGGKVTTGTTQVTGRFPANFIHDGSDEVVGLFPESKSIARKRGAITTGNIYNKRGECDTVRGHNDQGSAARFFYCAKAAALGPKLAA